MVKALSPRLQHLTAIYCADRMTGHQIVSGGNSLDLQMLRHCPLLASVLLDDLRPGQATQVLCISTSQGATHIHFSSAPCFHQSRVTALGLQSGRAMEAGGIALYQHVSWLQDLGHM